MSSPPLQWANLLHFYQPYGQKREIIDAITEQCYRPVAQGLLDNPQARLSINFTGVLLDQLVAYGHADVIDMYAEAARLGRVEFVGTSKYHAILPLLPEDEVLRQIEINNETSRKYLGKTYQPKGFFLPEMAWRPGLARLLEQAGFEWVMLDELAYNGRMGQVDYSKCYEAAGTKLGIVFRQHRLSASIMSAGPRSAAQLKQAVAGEFDHARYVVTGMDGETFGHHRVGHERLLIAMYQDPDITTVQVSDLFTAFPERKTVETVACTWASSEDDLAKGVQYISWDDPRNDIHRLQWELTNLTISELHRVPGADTTYAGLRAVLDRALASDQFFWAAARPWWMIEHIEAGAHAFLEVLRGAPRAGAEVVNRGEQLYLKILETAYAWQRSGKIDELSGERRRLVRLETPFRERTLERGGEGTWRAFRQLMQDEERTAAEQGDYEAAILWRNGLYNMEHKLDLYEAMYAVDLLRKKLGDARVDAVIAAYQERYDNIRGGQVEQRSN